MKNKIKVEFNKKEISDEEINHFKDFDKLLQQKDLVSKNSPFQYSLWLTGFLVVSGIALMFFLASDTQKQIIPEVIEEPSKESTLSITDDTSDEDILAQDLPVIQDIKNEEEVKTTARVEDKSHDENKGVESKKDSKQYQNAEKTQLQKQQPVAIETQNNGVVKNEFIDAHPKDGFNAVYDYFENELKYPEKAVQEKVSGTVLVEFTISQIGAIEKIKVIKTVSPEIDQEAIRLISGMPAWIPATFGDEKFSSKHTLPLRFQIK